MDRMMRVATALAATCLFSGAAEASTVFVDNFDSAPTTSGGIGATLSGVHNTGTVTDSSYGFSGSFLLNDSTGNPASATTLTLTNLPVLSVVDISLLLAFLDSWDSTDGASGATPDRLTIQVDGVTILGGLTANNASGTQNMFGAGSAVLGSHVQMDSNTRASDTIIDMGNTNALNFLHSGTTLTFSIFASGAGWQGGTDEAWGIDDLTVDVTAVPEPKNWTMMVGGFGLIGGALRRRPRPKVASA